ncbi:hypothetical protein PR003_g26942 [Phytophthora rubi]|uniref:Uncharacterized protein n=1 Tax=Phytophthora rubi TaxID=129364 RepID=A0A6A4C7X4_9STRA|nr:hypothetical protein PR002_g27959 [Phytophthora rubi]KAE9284105.1 hypothetical protein PR003_g26942 [Phytophthora rubi]
MDRGPNHLSRSRSRSPNRARRSINVDDVAEDQLRDIVVRGQQEWRSRSGASGKTLGVLCIFPGCTAKVMFTQSFANHFRAQHGMDRYTRGDRDQYERAIDDSELYRDSTQMTRVLQHRLQNQELGLQQVARNVSTVSGTVDDLRREVLMSARNTGSTAGLARAVDGITEEVQDIDRKLEMLFTTIMQVFDKKLQGLHKSVVEDIRKDIFKLAEGLNTRYDYIEGIVLTKMDKSVAVNRLSKRQREEETEHCQTTLKVSRSACPRPAYNDNVIMEEMEELAQPDALMGSASATSSTSTPTSMPY